MDKAALNILFGISGLLLSLTMFIVYNAGVRCKKWKFYTVDPTFIEQYLNVKRINSGVETVNRDIAIFGMRRLLICFALIFFIMFIMAFSVTVGIFLEISGFI